MSVTPDKMLLKERLSCSWSILVLNFKIQQTNLVTATAVVATTTTGRIFLQKNINSEGNLLQYKIKLVLHMVK